MCMEKKKIIKKNKKKGNGGHYFWKPFWKATCSLSGSGNPRLQTRAEKFYLTIKGYSCRSFSFANLFESPCWHWEDSTHQRKHSSEVVPFGPCGTSPPGQMGAAHCCSPSSCCVVKGTHAGTAQRWKGFRAFFRLRGGFPPSVQPSLGSLCCPPGLKKPGWGGGPENNPPVPGPVPEGWWGGGGEGKKPPLEEASPGGPPWKIRLKKSWRSAGEPPPGGWSEGDLRKQQTQKTQTGPNIPTDPVLESLNQSIF